MVQLSSCECFINLLEENNVEIKKYAIQQLLANVDYFWFELSNYLEKFKLLFKSNNNKSVSLLISKIYFYLNDLDESLLFALSSEDLFDINVSNDYTNTLVNSCLDKYIQQRQKEANVDKRLEGIVERMIHKSIKDKYYNLALGLCLECKRLDLIESMVKEQSEMVKFILQNIEYVDFNFKEQLLSLLAKLNRKYAVECLLLLEDVENTHLLLKAIENELELIQTCFDLQSMAKQEFLSKLISKTETPKIVDILNGKTSMELNLEFLFKNNNSDLLIISNTKRALDGKSSLYHQAITISHAFMHSGTTIDSFLRENMDWLSKANNWAKFTATSALGVIHKGNVLNSFKLLEPYLPKDGVTGSAYSEGGALYALGLMHSGAGGSVLDHLLAHLKNTTNETIQHGACLGLGVSGMASANEHVYEELKSILFGDNAVAGEAAGLAMGLVMLGTASAKPIEEMLLYAHETEHEKIIRGLSVGVALIMYGKAKVADALILQMVNDKDSIIRFGGVYTIAMAYSGTGENKVVKQLLHIAVSDASDDVRRAAVTALGFVLFKTPEQVPVVVKLLSESYNPHVRYGSAMALGIACAGTGLPEAVELLDPLTKDTTDFVRQAALMALAMIFVQHNAASAPKSTEVRESYAKIITAKHEDALARYGAVLGQGIIDAGGRNVEISLKSPSGHPIMSAVAGMAIFTLSWYWYPLAHFLSMAFTPTAIIGVNKDLKPVNFEFVSKAKPSMFAYPPKTTPPKVDVVEKVATAVLSTTAKSKARAKQKEDDMQIDSPIQEVVDEKVEEEPTVQVEANFEVKQNMTRVVPNQLKFVEFRSDARYVPVKEVKDVGIVVMKNMKPEEPEDVMERVVKEEPEAMVVDNVEENKASDAAEEIAPPAPFVYKG